jgi:hypothetical protein
VRADAVGLLNVSYSVYLTTVLSSGFPGAAHEVNPFLEGRNGILDRTANRVCEWSGDQIKETSML